MYLKRQKYSANILQSSIPSPVIGMFGGVLLFENSYIFRYLYKFTRSLATYIMLFSQKLFSLSSHSMFVSNYSFCRAKKVRYSDININYRSEKDFMGFFQALEGGNQSLGGGNQSSGSALQSSGSALQIFIRNFKIKYMNRKSNSQVKNIFSNNKISINPLNNKRYEPF
jgi:hypothetical protein